MGDLVLRIEDAKASYERQILSELQETTQRLREIEAVIGPVRRVRDLRAEYANRQNSEVDYTIIISRTRGNNTININATSETILEPGDVVELKLNRREQGSSHQSPAALSRETIRFQGTPPLAEQKLTLWAPITTLDLTADALALASTGKQYASPSAPSRISLSGESR